MKNQEEYNQWFESMIKKHLDYPGKIETRYCESMGYLCTIIYHPSNQEKNIYLSSADQELTIFFSKYHAHFDSNDNGLENFDHEQEFKSLIKHVVDIINDKTLIYANYYFGQSSCCISTINNIKDLTNMLDFIDNNIEKTSIESWSGKYDRTFTNNDPASLDLYLETIYQSIFAIFNQSK